MTTPPKRGRGRPKGSVKPKLTDVERKHAALASANGKHAMSSIIADFNQTPAIHNKNVNDGHLEIVISRIAAGETLKSVCENLGISAALVRQRVCDYPELYGDALHEARRMSADQNFEEMIEVARDLTLDTARAKLIVDTLEKMAKVNNRARYGDKVVHDVRQVTINLDQGDVDLT